MEFVSNVDDILKVVGTVTLLPNESGIQMDLPDSDSDIHRIVFGHTSTGKKYVETVSSGNGNWPIYGEASLPEILAFARKAQEDRPDSVFTKELVDIVRDIELAVSK